MRTIIQNGTIVSDTAAFRADLLLEDGVVKAVGAGLSAPDAQVIEASGKYVLPGAVDVHRPGEHVERHILPAGGRGQAF